MKKAREALLGPGNGPLAIAVIWILVAQFGCALAWQAELLTRQAALVHWLLVGVLPAALALWGEREPAAE